MIEESRIKKNLTTFAFPRLSGTKFEFEAFNKLKEKIENLNLNFDIQNFTFSTFYSRVYPRIAFLSISLILLMLYLNISMMFSMIIIFTLLGLLIISIIITRKPEKIRFIPKYNSQNLLVKIAPRSNNGKNNDRIVVFMSHLDSKGQRFKIGIRIRLIKIWIWSSIALFIIISLKSLLFVEFEIIFYIIGLFPLSFNIISSMMIFLNSTTNSSEGAVDNASGIACNLELLNYYNILENRLHNYGMWFLFTGAEECGTMGVRHFYNNLRNFDVKKSIIFNFESIAKNVFLFPGGNEGNHALHVNQLLLNNKRNLTIKNYFTKRILGTHSDGGFLGDRGIQGYGIGGVETHAYMHTPNDSIDKVDTTVLERLCLALTDSLKEHDSNFFNI
ncbi:MAG: M28 family peptidase [Candidatus Thorarchaeota archaeon]